VTGQAAARAAAEAAARRSYGRLVAILAARTRDLAAAEDALADAFAAALRVWPARGVPDRPEAWLIVAARRALGHGRRRAATADAARATLALVSEAADAPAALPDARLGLLLACAHPVVDTAIRAPLMLQAVLGLDARRVGAAFLVSPAAMGQRLSRAKARIREAGVGFDPPGPEALAERLEPLLATIYAAFAAGWDAPEDAAERHGLSDEALWLARLTAALAPESAEARGLLALTLYVRSRERARRSADGAYAPLAAQDPALWDGEMIAEAERLLVEAAALGAPGRFQIEAAIQSAHVQRLVAGHVDGAPADWAAINALYAYLVTLTPSLGARVAQAAALAESGAPAQALALLDGLDARARSHQPWHAARARALVLCGRAAEAAVAWRIAAGMAEDAAVRAHLLSCAEECER
jgi:RNA polymerase sigma-70 factor (ECF subfamily)